jgi:hypothetical protein
VPVLKAANAAEFDRFRTLRGLGAKPLTTRFWAPNAFFASSKDVFATIEYAETRFVNAYLIAIGAAGPVCEAWTPSGAVAAAAVPPGVRAGRSRTLSGRGTRSHGRRAKRGP